jgi:hypothetical protein
MTCPRTHFDQQSRRCIADWVCLSSHMSARKCEVGWLTSEHALRLCIELRRAARVTVLFFALLLAVLSARCACKRTLEIAIHDHDSSEQPGAAPAHRTSGLTPDNSLDHAVQAGSCMTPVLNGQPPGFTVVLSGYHA